MTQALLPTSSPLPQDWHAYPGGRSAAAVNDGVDAHDSDGTYLYADGDALQVVLQLDAGTDPAVHDRHVLRVVHRIYKTGAATVTGTTAELLQGASTVIATLELPAPDAAWTLVEQELTPAEAAAITDYGDLRLRLTSGAFALTGSAYAEHRVSACQLDVPDVGSVVASGSFGMIGAALAVASLTAAGLLSMTGTATAQPWSQASGTVTVTATATASSTLSSPTFTPHASYNWIPFCSVTSGVPDHPVLRCAYFEGVGTAPASGRAAIAVPLISDMLFTEQPTEITADSHPLYHTYLMAGYGVWLVSMPVARGDTPPLPAISSATFDLSVEPHEMGPAYVGNGTTYSAQVSITPPWLALAPVRDPEWLMAWKTFAMFSQWLADGNGEAAGVDMTKLGGRGASAGADTLLHTTWGPNLAPQMFPSGTGQDAISTRGIYKAFVAYIAPIWANIFEPTFPGRRWPENAAPGDVPAETKADADPTLITQDSALWYGTLPAVYASNQQIPAYFAYRLPSVTGEPYTKANFSEADSNPHVDWSGRAAKFYFPNNVTLVAYTGVIYDPLIYDELVDTNALGVQAGYDHEVAWMSEALGWDITPTAVATGTFTISGSATASPAGFGFYERVANLLRGLVGTVLEDSLGLPVQFDNEPQDAPAAPATHVRASLQYEGAERLDFGTANPSFRARGELLLEFRTPLDMGEEALLQAVDAARDALQHDTSAPPVILRTPSLEVLGADAGYWTATLRVPFHADNTAATAVATAGATGNQKTLEQVADVLRARFGTYIEDGQSIPVVYDNEGEAPPSAARWVRLTLLPGESAPIGRVAQATEYRMTGLLVAQVFVGADMGDQPAWDLVDSIDEQFRAVADAGVSLRTPTVRVVGRDGAWWQVNVSCPFIAAGAQ